jgi:hypothetical protein
VHGEISFPVAVPAAGLDAAATAGGARGRGPALLAILCASALAALLPAPVTAQPSSTAAAESLFNEGRELMQQGNFPAACEKFAASHALEPSVGALLNLGDCREKNGQVASAWVAYRQASAGAQRAGDHRRARVAQQHAERLAPRLSYLVIAIPDQARIAGLRIMRDGEVIEEPLWGQRAPVDPGEHEIRVEAPGYLPQTLTATVAPGSKVVEVAVPVLEPAPPGEQPDAPPDTPGTPGPGAQTGQQDDTPAGGLDDLDQGGGVLTTGRKVAIGGGVLAVAGVVTGVVFALRSQSRWDEAQDGHCNDLGQCTDPGLALAAQASDAATISSIAYGAGIGLLIGSAALWLLSPPQPATGERADSAATGPAWRPLALTPMVGPDRAGLTLEGRF